MFRLIATLAFYVYSQLSLAVWVQDQKKVMGTIAKVEVWAESQTQARQAIAQVFGVMERVNQSMSPYIESSELYLLNKEAHRRPVSVSNELFDLLSYSNQMSELTQGVFDITFSSIGYLYDYRKGLKPTDEKISKLKEAINYRLLDLNATNKTVLYRHKNVKIDLGGIAKGYAVDESIKALKRLGFKHALVSAGGDSRIIGDRRGRPWYIGIKHPREENKIISKLPLVNVAVSTSGDYERYFEQEGVRYHHIIDPKTGKSSKRSQSATIIADNSTYADALSTSVFILGPEKGLKLIDSLPNVSAIIVDSRGKVQYSSDLVQMN